MKMSNIKSFRWWKYFISLLIGILIFVSVIPSCKQLSSSNSGDLVRENKSENSRGQKSTILQTKSLEEIVANLPTAEKIRTMPIASHPRILASEARFAEIRAQIKTDKLTKLWYKELLQQANTLLRQKPSAYQAYILSDTRRLATKIHSKIPILALVYQVEKDERYLKRAWQELEAVALYRDWNPNHFLNTAMVTYAFAIGYDWLYEDLSIEQRHIISSAIVKKGLKPAMDAYGSEAMWIKAEHNWNQVCNGGVTLGALAVMEDYPGIASQVLAHSLQGLPHAMHNYSPSGGWDEGLKYWNYGTFYNTAAIASLKTSLNRDFDLPTISGFSETGLFPIYMNGTSNIPFNYSDGDDEPIGSPALFWMSEQFNQPVYKYYQKQAPVHGAMDLIWYHPSNKKETLGQLPLDHYFEGTEVASMREEWENPDSIYIGFKAGDNKATHSNLDLGTFVLDALGKRWATDLGRDDYNLPGYFDQEKQRWTYYKTRAEGQNTLVINPSQGADQDPQAKAKITRFDSQPEQGYAIADLTSAYYPQTKKVQRGISLQEHRQQILVQDEIESDAPIDLLWFMHTKADIQISKDGKSVMLRQGDQRLWAKLLNPEPNYKFTVMNAQPLATSPNPQGQAKNLNLKKLTIQLKKIQNVELAVLFVPLKQGQKIPQKFQQTKALAQW